MRSFAKLTERELDGILAGNAPDGELEDVAAFVRELRVSLPAAPRPAVESSHLAGIFEAARLLDPPAAEPTVSSRVPWKLRNPFRPLAARATIAAIGFAALATFGGAAYAGALPAPVQSKVADLAGKVGLSLPGDRDRSPQRGGNGVQDNGGETGQSTVDQPGQVNQGNADHGNGDQGNGGTNHQQGGDQGSGDQGSSDQGSSGQQGSQTSTVRGGRDEPGTQGAGSADQGSNQGGNEGSGQQGNGTGDGAGSHNG